MYQNYERINEYLHSIQADMNIEYLYIQMIQDHSSVYSFDPSSGYLTLGHKEELSERFDKLKGNERLEPTVSRTEFDGCHLPESRYFHLTEKTQLPL